MNDNREMAEAAVTTRDGKTAVTDSFISLPAFRVRAAALPRIKAIENRVSVVVLLLVPTIAAITWQGRTEVGDLLELLVDLLAVFVPIWVLVSGFIASIATRNEIEATCRPRHIARRAAYTLLFIGLYVSVIAVHDSAWMRILAAAFLVGFVSILGAYWRFARSYPVAECKS